MRLDFSVVVTVALVMKASSLDPNSGHSCFDKIYPPSLREPCGSQMDVRSPDHFQIIFGTNLYGSFSADCRRDRAPSWVDRVFNLALNGYYNYNYFFRVIPNKYIQFGTNGYPAISNCYNIASPELKPCAIIEPQPPDMPINVGGIHGLSNVFGTMSMSTSYNESTASTWNATAELFINIGNNSDLDDMLYVPICTISREEMDSVVLSFPSFGEVEELGGDGPSLNQLYAEGNDYIQSNPEWATMAETTKVRITCQHVTDNGRSGSDLDQICGPCVVINSSDETKDDNASFPYDHFSLGDKKWYCPSRNLEEISNTVITVGDSCTTSSSSELRKINHV